MTTFRAQRTDGQTTKGDFKPIKEVEILWKKEYTKVKR